MKLQKSRCLLSLNDEESISMGRAEATTSSGTGGQLGRDNGGYNLSLLLCIFDSSRGKAGLADPWAGGGMTKETCSQHL